MVIYITNSNIHYNVVNSNIYSHLSIKVLFSSALNFGQIQEILIYDLLNTVIRFLMFVNCSGHLEILYINSILKNY